MLLLSPWVLQHANMGKSLGDCQCTHKWAMRACHDLSGREPFRQRLPQSFAFLSIPRAYVDTPHPRPTSHENGQLQRINPVHHRAYSVELKQSQHQFLSPFRHCDKFPPINHHHSSEHKVSRYPPPVKTCQVQFDFLCNRNTTRRRCRPRQHNVQAYRTSRSNLFLYPLEETFYSIPYPRVMLCVLGVKRNTRKRRNRPLPIIASTAVACASGGLYHNECMEWWKNYDLFPFTLPPHRRL